MQHNRSSRVIGPRGEQRAGDGVAFVDHGGRWRARRRETDSQNNRSNCTIHHASHRRRPSAIGLSCGHLGAGTSVRLRPNGGCMSAATADAFKPSLGRHLLAHHAVLALRERPPASLHRSVMHRRCFRRDQSDTADPHRRLATDRPAADSQTRLPHVRRCLAYQRWHSDLPVREEDLGNLVVAKHCDVIERRIS